MPKNFLSLFYILIAIFSVQFGASVAKKLFPVAGPAGTTMLRVGLAALLLVLMWRPWKEKWTRKQVVPLIFYGISLGGMNLCYYIAIARIPLGIAVALEFTGPLGLAIVTSKKTFDFLWAILAAVGIWLILPVNQSGSGLDMTGIFFALLAGVFWAFYIVAGKMATRQTHSGRATALGMVFAALVTLPFGIALNGKEALHLSLLPMGLLIAFFSSALPYSLEMMAMKNIPTKTFGILMSMEPAAATLMGFVFLNEHLSALQLFAIVLIIIASLGTTVTHSNS